MLGRSSLTVRRMWPGASLLLVPRHDPLVAIKAPGLPGSLLLHALEGLAPGVLGHVGLLGHLGIGCLVHLIIHCTCDLAPGVLGHVALLGHLGIDCQVNLIITCTCGSKVAGWGLTAQRLCLRGGAAPPAIWCKQQAAHELHATCQRVSVSAWCRLGVQEAAARECPLPVGCNDEMHWLAC